MLTLDEAIKHCEEKAEEIRKANEEMPTDCKLSEDLCECANEHEQLAEWLKDYKRLLETPRGDLISREDLKKKLTPLKLYGNVYCKAITEKDIDNAPTVAVDCKDCDGYEAGYSAGLKDAEIPRGFWAEFEGGYRCSNCDDIEAYTPNFCPDCGAKMKGGKE